MPGIHGSGGCKCADAAQDVEGGKQLIPPGDFSADSIVCLNACNPSSAKLLFRPMRQKLEEGAPLPCRSPEDDGEIIISLTFPSPVVLDSICVVGGDNGTTPGKVRLYTDHTVDFSDVNDLSCQQEINLVEDFCGVLKHPLRVARFSNLRNLSMYFSEPVSGRPGPIEIFYIQLDGKNTQWKREPVVANYELIPQKDKLAEKDAEGQQQRLG